MDIESKPSLKEARLRIIVSVVTVMLSVDFLNPVKIMGDTLGIGTLWAVPMAVFLFGATVFGNLNELLYHAIVVFLKSILSIFYSSIEVLGKQNVPAHGPVIFTGNHMNQFVDGAMVFATNPHRVRFMVAAKSFSHKVVGPLSRATGCIPVARPQDSAQVGEGKIRIDGNTIYGDGTCFTKLKPGDKIRCSKSASAFGVKNVVSDTYASLGVSDDGKDPSMEPQNTWMGYKVLKFVDQSEMFAEVHKALSHGQCLGIFPEGGSHDRTDLLPLKAGVAAIAYGAMEKYGINVPIVPVGLTYWSGSRTGGDRFRGRAVVEFGQPIRISPEMAQKYKKYKHSRREAYTDLLSRVSEGMRSVIVTADNYEELQLIHTTRRLYKRPAQTVNIRERQELSRRFAVAVKIIKGQNKGQLPEKLQGLRDKISDYQKKLDYWGLKDYQINKVEVSFFKLLYTFVHGLTVIIIAAMPSILLNWPVGMFAKLWAEKMAKVDLANSVVKLKGRDVVMSKIIVYSLALVPSLWFIYALLLWFFAPLTETAIMLIVMAFPIFSYIGVMAVEAGMVDLKDLRPAFLRLVRPSFRRDLEHLSTMRAQLQTEVRATVKVYGPDLGALYYDKDFDINAYRRERSGLEEDEADAVGTTDGGSANGKEGDLNGTDGDSVRMESTEGGLRSVPSEFNFATGDIDVPEDLPRRSKTD